MEFFFLFLLTVLNRDPLFPVKGSPGRSRHVNLVERPCRLGIFPSRHPVFPTILASNSSRQDRLRSRPS